MGIINKGGFRPVKGKPEVIEVTLRAGTTVYAGNVLRKLVVATSKSFAVMSGGNSYPLAVACEYTAARSTEGTRKIKAWRVNNLNVIWEGKTDTSNAYGTTILERIGDKCDMAIQTSNFRVNWDAGSQKLLQIYDLNPNDNTTTTAPKRVYFRWTATAVSFDSP